MGAAAAQLRIRSAASDPVLGEQLASLRWNWKGQPRRGSSALGFEGAHGPKNSLISGP